jgi:hypothetical protein
LYPNGIRTLPELDGRFHETDHMHNLVIPGRRAAANPESITPGLWLWVPAFGLGRNDAHMIRTSETRD